MAAILLKRKLVKLRVTLHTSSSLRGNNRGPRGRRGPRHLVESALQMKYFITKLVPCWRRSLCDSFLP